MKKIISLIILIIIIGAGYFYITKSKGETQKFRTEEVSRGDIRAAVTATGTVNPVSTVLVGTQVSGTIKSIYVDFNSFVKKGDLLAQIDPATFEGQVEQARANLAAAQANLEKARAALIDAQRTLERNRLLYARNLIAKSELDTAETNEMTARAQLRAQEAQVEQMKAALTVAETNLRYTKIISPVDGMVISRNVDVGQTVAASFQTPTLFTIARDLSKMQIDTNVDEADIGRVRVGQPVEFTVDAYPERIFKGRVTTIRNAPIIVQNVVTYDVIVTVANPELILKPGMTANVSIITATKRNVLKIPNAALRFRMREKEEPRGKGKGASVWVLRDNKPKRVTITPGISDGNYTEVVAGEIGEKDEVIVALMEKRDKKGSVFTGRWFH